MTLPSTDPSRKPSSLWSSWYSGCLIALISALGVTWNADLKSDPRFDGSGYAILGEALATGQGYRELDHPDRPRHAHFPPGYPITLAILWTLTGRSVPAAHVWSIACTVSATVVTWWWFRRLYAPRVAFILAAGVAVNWTWTRIGGEIQSEPEFLLVHQLAVLASLDAKQRGGWKRGILVGILLGAAILIRHVGVCLALAVGIDFLLRDRRSAAFWAGVTAAIVVTPWIAWLLLVRHNTQAALFAQAGLAERVASQALFYLRRIPDQLTGPIVEVGTVFQRSPWLAAILTGWAAVATSIAVFGWSRTLSTRRRRLAGLVALLTLAVLLVWPFTEAGRFLIPLLPAILVGLTEGLGRLGALLRRRMPRVHLLANVSPRTWAALGLLALSLPYSVYAIVSHRADAQRRTHHDFDAACRWILQHGDAPGPILTRHPGEVYWRTRHQALVPGTDDPDAVAHVIDRYAVAYLLVDEERYARASANVLTEFVARHPHRVQLLWRQDSGGSSIAIYRILAPGNSHPAR